MASKTIIVPSYGRKELMKDLLGKTDLVFGTEVLSLNAYKSSLVYENLDRAREKAELFGKIRNDISQNNAYRDQLRFPAFFDYFYSFANKLARLSITQDDIPDDEPDKKEILGYLLKQPLIEKKLAEAFSIINDANGTEICDYLYPDLLDRQDIEALIKKGAVLTRQQPEKGTQFTCMVANNPVREVISVAQYLINEKEKENFNIKDYVLMINNEEEYYPLIERVFYYYKIPYSLSISTYNAAATRMALLLDLIRKQNMPSFLAAFNNHVFGRDDYSLTAYINKFSLSYDQLLQPIDQAEKLLNDPDKKIYLQNTFGKNKVEEMQQWQQKCEDILKDIRPVLTSQKFIDLKSASLKEQCGYAYEFLFSKQDELSKQQLDDIQKVHDLLISMVPQFSDEESGFEMLYESLMNTKTSVRKAYKDAITISDPYSNSIDKKIAIILGCCQQFYPMNVAVSSFFDEDYIAKIGKYPSLLERTQWFEKEYDRFLHQFEKVIFSYPAAGVDGSKYAMSTLLADYCPKDEENKVIETPWPLWQSDKENKSDVLKLDLETAKKIYSPKGYLNASPSAMQSYVGCPFRYFLERGLKFSDEQPLQIGANTIGSIQHNLLERYFNDEIIMTEDNIEEQLKPYFELMKELMVNDAEEIDAMKSRLAKGLVRSVRFLKDFKKDDNYDYHPEEKIDYYFTEGGINFHINRGSIDRLDVKGDYYRIIDYKSSEKNVSMNNVKKGINFQLLAYLVFYYLKMKESGKDMIPDMFAYFSTKNSTIKAEDVDKKHVMSDEQIRSSDVRYDAYITDGQMVSPFDQRYFESAVKNNEVFAERADLEYVVRKLYEAIGTRILSGNIEIEPTNGYCTFCNYSELCHHDKQDTVSPTDMKDLV